MNNFKTFIFVLVILTMSKSYAFSKDFIGVISVGIGEIINQNSAIRETASFNITKRFSLYE